MTKELRKPIGSYWRKPEGQPTAFKAGKVIFSYLRNFRHEPSQQQIRKPIGSYWRKPQAA
jgi:hypothetical protein